MDETSKRRAPWLWRAAVAVGGAAFGAGLAWARAEPGLDWVWAVAAAGVGVVAYSLAFFLGCALFAPGFAGAVRDDTEVHGDTVTHVVRHAETGDPRLDFYLRAYAAARATSAVAISIVVLGGAAWWLF